MKHIAEQFEFEFIKRKTPDRELHNYCPICKNSYVLRARDFNATSHCANNHTWALCCKCGNTVIGMPRRNTFECICDSTAYYRTKL
jgi:hypothetical protein